MTKFVRYLFAMLFFALLAAAAPAQVAPMPFVQIQWFNNNGQPCAGCLLYTYAAGTSTPQTTYSDALGSVPNADPVVADAAGRMNVFMGANAYKFILNLPAGVQLWSIDNVTSSVLALLALNNTWSGTQTFNGVMTFNATPVFNTGFTAGGPVTLGFGGSLAGTFSGSPIFSGAPSFSGGFTATTGIFSGQITSTLATGTAPFVVTSTTLVPNLNVAQLGGCTWAIPCALGSTTPNTVAATTVNASTSLTVNGSTPQTGVQGTDTKLLSAGTMTGTGASLCTDGNGGATTSGCAATGFTQIEVAKSTSICTTPGGSYANCSTSISWPSAFADSNYMATCNGINATQFPVIMSLAKSPSAVTVTISNGTANGAQLSTYAEVDCIGIHP